MQLDDLMIWLDIYFDGDIEVNFDKHSKSKCKIIFNDEETYYRITNKLKYNSKNGD